MDFLKRAKQKSDITEVFIPPSSRMNAFWLQAKIAKLSLWTFVFLTPSAHTLSLYPVQLESASERFNVVNTSSRAIKITVAEDPAKRITQNVETIGTTQNKELNQAKSCTLETKDGEMTYYVAKSGNISYISSAKKAEVAPDVVVIGLNSIKAGTVIVSANAPQGSWKVSMAEPTLVPDVGNQNHLRVTRGDWDSDWRNNVSRVPQVAPNQKAKFNINVRFKLAGLFPANVYRSMVLVECLAV